jgi:hypothetical protein
MVQTLWDSITQSITGAPSADDIRRRREDESAFSSLYDAARQRDAELAAAGRRPVLGGLLSKEPVAGMDTLRYEGITPLILGLLSPVARAVDAPMAAYQGNIPMQDMAGEALGTAGMAALGGAALTRPAGSLGSNTLRVYHGGTGDVTNAASGRGAGLPAPRNEAEAMARNILEMRAAGRAGDVTEEMRAAADPMYMYQNTPLPMDEASRMARAREIGRVDDQYHATLADFQAFRPSETGLVGRGVYSGDFPTDIEDYARKQGTSDGLNIIPLLAPSEQTYARRIDWQNLVDADEAFPWNATVDETIQGFKRAADTMSSQGYSGVNSQPGERATFDPASLRSRFALFDPEFRHLRNLSAGIGGLGLLSLPQDEEMQ